MRSLRIIFLAIAVGLVGLAAEAQQKTLLQTEIMAKKLGLNAKQKADLDKHFKSIKSEKEALQLKMKGLREEMQRDQFVNRQEQEAKLKSILTEEQFAKVQEQRKRGKRAQMVKGQRGRANGQMRSNQMQQKRKMAAIQGREQGNRQRMQRGQRGQQRQFGAQGQQRQMQFRKMLESNPELKKKFQEFLEQEKQKKEKSGGGN